MIVVTGGAGFIGSNLVSALNARGETDIVVVDDLSDGSKFVNLVDCEIADYLDKDEFAALLHTPRRLSRPRAIIHMGACSSTTEWDGRFMMRENYAYSKALAAYAAGHQVPLLYASSASVYGAGRQFAERREHEGPLNVYGFSKFQFDQFVRRNPARSQMVGFRFFNVYGPREQHKGTMASVAWHFHRQLVDGNSIRLFEGSDGYGPGEQRRDFVYVDDACDIVLWFLDRPHLCGIYNVGTGRAQSFNEVAEAVRGWHGRGAIEYIPFPEHLRGRYQSYTEADLGALRAQGCTVQPRSVEAGVARYLDWLAQRPDAGGL
jgi:ADP-L-glycero-D-manno-heptose 6-epimerase